MDFNRYSETFLHKALDAGFTVAEVEDMLGYAKRLSEQGLPIIYDQEHLSLLLGYDYFYLLTVSNSQHSHYKHYQIPKNNGGFRIIEEPFPALKEVQTWILKEILEPASKCYVSPVAKAFIPGKSLKENARFHKNKKYVVALDLQDFFGSIKYHSVYGLFLKFGYNKSVSTMLANLCVLYSSLPQGAPTSPMLSNLVFQELDEKIFTYCRRRKIMYTRYADDMTFSSDSMDVTRLISYIRMVVTNRGYRINDEKTNVMGRGACQKVTGVVVNEKLQVPKVYRDKVRQEVYYIIKYGPKEHMSRIKLPIWMKTTKLYIKHLLGKVNYILSINPKDEEFLRYASLLKNYLHT